MRVVSGRFRVGRLDDVMRDMAAVIAEARRRRRVRLVVMWAILLLWVALTLNVPEALGLWIVCVMFTLAFGLMGAKALPRKQAKYEFTRELLHVLADDLHPLAKHSMTFDPRHYDTASKRTWTGTSAAGRAKHKYTDKWLDLDLVLADGSRLRLRCQAGVKEKRGNIVSEKRRVFVVLEPDDRRYDLATLGRDLGQLKKRFKLAGRETTGAADERFHVHPTLREGAIRVRVTQMDAPVSVTEVMRLVEAIVGYVAEHPRRRAA
jgi:hypothetical protein